MPVHESELPDMVVKLPTIKLDYPVSINEHLSKPFFVMLAAGGRGSGKTYAIATLLRLYERYPFVCPVVNRKCDQRIFLFSPTYQANPILHDLRYLDKDDIHSGYTDDTLKNMMSIMEASSNATKKYQRAWKAWQKYIKRMPLDAKEQMILEDCGWEEPDRPKPYNTVFHMVCDDMVSSSMYRNGRSPFTQFLLRNRHLRCCVYIATQAIKGIPRPIRLNSSVMVLFKFANSTTTLDLYEEVSNKVTEEQFLELYDYATSKDHGYLVVDFTVPKNECFKCGFDRILKLSDNCTDERNGNEKS